MKIVNIDGYNFHIFSYLPNDLRNFNQIFRKDVTYEVKFSHYHAAPHHPTPVPTPEVFDGLSLIEVVQETLI